MARERGRAVERRRRERAEQRAALKRAAARRRALLWGGAILVLGAALVLFLATRPPPPGAEETETFPDQGRTHLAAGAPTPAYNSDPPTSGPHAPVPAPCGIHRAPVADIAQVHTLEHGAVIIQYRPGLPEQEVGRLEEIATDLGDWTMVAPREGVPAPIALTAWTKRLLLDEVDEAAIRAFHRRFARQGPEQALCPFEARP